MDTPKQCPVCDNLIDADVAAFEQHVNSHFPEGGSDSNSGSSSAPRSGSPSPGPTRPVLPRASSFKRARSPKNDPIDECPICSYPFAETTTDHRQGHVETFIDSAGQSKNSTPDTSSSHSSRSFVPRGGTAQPMSSDTASSTLRAKDTEANLSETLFQQARGPPKGYVAADWDGPAQPGGSAQWRKRKVDKGDYWSDPASSIVLGLPANIAPGLIPVIMRLLDTAVRRGVTRSAVLSLDTTLIRGVFNFDKTWGCGYRNALMALSALIKRSPAFKKMFSREINGADPGVRRLQGWLDEAWASGYDLAGQKHFGGAVLGGRKWIGTGELYALFTYKGVPCNLYDFTKPKKAGDKPAHELLNEWVFKYFDEGLNADRAQTKRERATSAVNAHAPPANAFDVLMGKSAAEANPSWHIAQSTKYPLILQHNGHSRTIVGYERLGDGNINLLIFDPGRGSLPSGIRDAGLQHMTSSDPTKPQTNVGRSASDISHKNSHESIPFARPYSNGASEITILPEGAKSPGGPGAQESLVSSAAKLSDDEEVDRDGWIRKKAQTLKRAKRAPLSLDPADVAKSLGYFRVNLHALSRHTEYQVLAFTGDEPLSPAEQSMRKRLSSTIVR